MNCRQWWKMCRWWKVFNWKIKIAGYFENVQLLSLLKRKQATGNVGHILFRICDECRYGNNRRSTLKLDLFLTIGLKSWTSPLFAPRLLVRLLLLCNVCVCKFCFDLFWLILLHWALLWPQYWFAWLPFFSLFRLLLSLLLLLHNRLKYIVCEIISILLILYRTSSNHSSV